MSGVAAPAGMVACPACGFHNVQGEDVCEGCGHDLQDMATGDGLGAELTQVKVAELESHANLSIAPTATVADAISLMVAKQHGEVVIVEKGKVVGIFTERDIIFRVIALSRDPAATQLRQVMTPNVETVSVTDPIAVAVNKMAVRNCRHLPVIKQGKCTGMVSVRNVLNYLAGHMKG